MSKNLTKTFSLIFTLIFISSQVLLSQTDANIPIKGICIYIDYPDAPINVDPDRLDKMMNDLDYQEDGINRSFRKYWQQESRRNYDITHDIFYYTAPETAAYYSTIQWFDVLEMWKDALESVIANNPDYDWDALSKWSPGDIYNPDTPDYLIGAIKSTIMISSVYGPQAFGGAHHPRWTLSNGQFIGTAQGSMLQRPWDATLNLFTLLHETGHSLFNLPDTYDLDASSGGTAKYTLMSAQGPDVEPVGAPFLYRHNWGHIIEPEIGTHEITLRADGDSIVVIKNPHDSQEFFSLEVRKKDTPGNSLFSTPLGLLIWHSDRKVNTGNTLEDGTRYAHYKHSVIQKDGLMELEKGGPGPPVNIGDIYLDGDEFNDDTTPDAKWWAGEESGIEIKDIVLIDDDHIKFTVVISELHEEHFDFLPKENWSLIYSTAPQFGYEGEKAFDNDLSTYFHVPGNSTAPRPHEIMIELGDDYEISEFYYQANDNYSPPWEGRIRDYELHFSMDGENWGAPVVKEQFFQSEYRQYALIEPTVARYIRVSAFSTYWDDNRTSIAELDFRGRKAEMTSINEEPQNTLDNIRLSPNPTSEFLYIQGLSDDNVIKVYDAFGVLKSEVTNPRIDHRLEISDYPIGIYFLKISNEKNNQIMTKKVVKI